MSSKACGHQHGVARAQEAGQPCPQPCPTLLVPRGLARGQAGGFSQTPHAHHGGERVSRGEKLPGVSSSRALGWRLSRLCPSHTVGRREPRGPALGLAPASAHAQPQGSAYQGATAEQDHEDNEGLKPVVLDDLEAGPAEGPPRLPAALGDVHVEAGTALHTGWGSKGAPRHGPGGCLPMHVSMFPSPPRMPPAPRPAPHCPPDPASLLPPNPRPHVLHCWLEMGPGPPLEWGSQALPPQPTAPMCQLLPGMDAQEKDKQGCGPPAQGLSHPPRSARQPSLRTAGLCSPELCPEAEQAFLPEDAPEEDGLRAAFPEHRFVSGSMWTRQGRPRGAAGTRCTHGRLRSGLGGTPAHTPAWCCRAG